jgi:glycerol uptake facilitator-like aquaporin
VIGSGIMGEQLAQGNVALALLANTIATGAALFALIVSFAPISGAHFNPLVTIAAAYTSNEPWSDGRLYIAAQVAGAVAGVVVAHLMFGMPALSMSTHVRHGAPQLFSELVATFGLLSVISATSMRHFTTAAAAIAAYIVAAYWFTASTSFANPALTIARSLSDSFAGIDARDAPGFIAAQTSGAIAAVLFFRWMFATDVAVEGQSFVPAPESIEETAT